MTNSLDVKRAAPPPNWYRDRSDPSLLRYWDGTRWTDHTSPVPSRDTATPQAQADTDEVTPPSVVARDTAPSAYLASGSFSLWDREDRSTAGVRAADDTVSSATPGESSSRSASATDAIEDASATGDDDAVSRLAECSYCYGSVHPTARKCMHCGEFLDDALKAEREHEAIAQSERSVSPSPIVSVDPRPWPGAGFPETPPLSQPTRHHPVARVNGLAIAAMVLGIVWLWWIGSILAVIFGRVAMKQIDNSEGSQTGRGMAIAGLVLGLVGIGFLVFMVAVTVLGNNASDKFDHVGTSINTG